MAKKTSWGLIIAGIVAFTMIVGVGLMAVAGYFVFQQFAFKSVTTDPREAGESFEQVARRYQGEEPMLIIQDGEAVLNDAAMRPRHGRRRPHIDAVHVMAWDPQEARMISLNIPFWLIRMTNGHPIKLSAGNHEDTGRPNLVITADDLERHGPGLIFKLDEPGGDRVIVWAQ